MKIADSSLALEVSNLSHIYGKGSKARQALQSVNFKVKAGEMLAILGPNGGGKSTLFKILSTLISPQSGSVRIHGYDVSADLLKLRSLLGVVFQSPALDKRLTVLENLLHQGELYGMSGKLLNARCQELLEVLDIAERANETVLKLSGGLQRRVEIAKALLHHPKILLMDEPSTGLDPGVRIKLWDVLKKLNRQFETTILVTTHFLDEVDHCPRVIILNEGVIRADDTPNRLKQCISSAVLRVVCVETERALQLLSAHYEVRRHEHSDIIDIMIPENQRPVDIISRVSELLGQNIESISWEKPSMADVYAKVTGHDWEDLTD